MDEMMGAMPPAEPAQGGAMIACPKCGCQLSLAASPMDNAAPEEGAMPPEEPMPEAEPDGDEYDSRVAEMQQAPGRRKFQNPGAVADALRTVGKRSM